MSSNSDGNALTINAAFLKSLVQYQLQPLLDQVNTLLQNGQKQHIHGAAAEVLIPQIDGTLSVPAGGVAQPNGGGNSFLPASELINALGKVGGSVNTNLNWFQQALSDTIDEIGTAVTSMKDYRQPQRRERAAAAAGLRRRLQRPQHRARRRRGWRRRGWRRRFGPAAVRAVAVRAAAARVQVKGN